MKFSCYKSDLVDALKTVMGAVAVKPMTPILSGIYMHAEGSALELQANDLARGIITKIPVNAEIAGETVVSGKRLAEFVRNMPDDTITFSEIDNSLNLASGGANVNLLAMNPADFPKVKIPDADNHFKINVATLAKAVRRTVFAVSKDESRPVFTGVNFKIAGGYLTLCATNTHRIAVDKIPLPADAPQGEFVVPASTLRSLLFDFDDHAEVAVSWSGRNVSFDFGNNFVTSRIIEGTFPPIDRLLNEEKFTFVDVDTAEFKAAIDFVALMSKESEYNAIKLELHGDQISIFSTSPDIGNAVKSIDANISGADLTIAFDANYLTDFLKIIDAKRLNIAFGEDHFKPAKFTADGDDLIYIVTPVRT